MADITLQHRRRSRSRSRTRLSPSFTSPPQSLNHSLQELSPATSLTRTEKLRIIHILWSQRSSRTSSKPPQPRYADPYETYKPADPQEGRSDMGTAPSRMPNYDDHTPSKDGLWTPGGPRQAPVPPGLRDEAMRGGRGGLVRPPNVPRPQPNGPTAVDIGTQTSRKIVSLDSYSSPGYAETVADTAFEWSDEAVQYYLAYFCSTAAVGTTDKDTDIMDGPIEVLWCMLAADKERALTGVPVSEPLYSKYGASPYTMANEAELYTYESRQYNHYEPQTYDAGGRWGGVDGMEEVDQLVDVINKSDVRNRV